MGSCGVRGEDILQGVRNIGDISEDSRTELDFIEGFKILAIRYEGDEYVRRKFRWKIYVDISQMICRLALYLKMINGRHIRYHSEKDYLTVFSGRTSAIIRVPRIIHISSSSKVEIGYSDDITEGNEGTGSLIGGVITQEEGQTSVGFIKKRTGGRDDSRESQECSDKRGQHFEMKGK